MLLRNIKYLNNILSQYNYIYITIPIHNLHYNIIYLYFAIYNFLS